MEKDLGGIDGGIIEVHLPKMTDRKPDEPQT